MGDFKRTIDLIISSFFHNINFYLGVRIAASPNCFKEGTLVETEDGLKPIEEIQVGDKVLAYDEQTGKQAYKKVVQLFRNQTNEWYHIHVNGEEIICTGGHPFYVAELDKFIPARELAIGTKLLLSTGVCAIIEAIQIEQLEAPETTYNFEVEDFHTYYVTESKVLVHNMCGKPEMANRGSTGRTEANNLVEKLAMEQVKSDPLNGAEVLNLSLRDNRWAASEGWMKMQTVVRSGSHNTTIHFVYNQTLNLVDDFKFIFFKTLL